MKDFEENYLKELKEDIKILKKCNITINDIKEYINIYRDYSNDNTEEYKKEIDKLMEKIK